MQYQSEFVVDIPVRELDRTGQELDLLVRVTPSGHAPVYLRGRVLLRNLVDIRGEAELKGEFVAGEGSYRVEALVRDHVPRVCYNSWSIQVQSAGSEGGLKTIAPAGAVLEAGFAAPPAVPPLEIRRLTVLVDATYAIPGSAGMEPETVAALSDSLYSLLSELPAKSVRLRAFNLDRQVVVLSNDDFQVGDVGELTQQFDQLQLAVLDLKALERRQKKDVLADLLFKEMQDPRRTSAVIFIGPRLFEPIDKSISAALTQSGIPWFYLQYEPVHLVEKVAGTINVFAGQLPDVVSQPLALAADGIEQLVRNIHGTVFSIRSPHDFSDAIEHLRSAIPATASALDKTDEAPAPGERSARPVREDPVAVLADMRDRLDERLLPVPDHLCVETVERNHYALHSDEPIRSCANLLHTRRLAGHRLTLDDRDRLRLEVRMAGGREYFAWPGADRVAEGNIARLIPEGAFSSGPFASMLRDMVDGRNPEFEFAGESEFDGRRVLQYNLRTRPEASHYRVKAGTGWIVTGYTATLLIDPGTENLVRLEIRTDELPAETQACQIDTTLDYNMASLGGFEYLLPKSTRQRFVGTDGSEVENRVSFGGCRSFEGESTVSFGAPQATRVDPATAPPPRSLPVGAELTVELKDAFALDSAAAGDIITGRLVNAVRDPRSGKLLAPAGAVLHGRLTRVELLNAGESEYRVTLRWQTLDLPGAQAKLALRPKAVPPAPRPKSRGLQRRPNGNELVREVGQLDVTYRFPAEAVAPQGRLRTVWLSTGN